MLVAVSQKESQSFALSWYRTHPWLWSLGCYFPSLSLNHFFWDGRRRTVHTNLHMSTIQAFPTVTAGLEATVSPLTLIPIYRPNFATHFTSELANTDTLQGQLTLHHLDCAGTSPNCNLVLFPFLPHRKGCRAAQAAEEMHRITLLPPANWPFIASLCFLSFRQ